MFWLLLNAEPAFPSPSFLTADPTTDQAASFCKLSGNDTSWMGVGSISRVVQCSPFWCPPWGSKHWDNSRSVQSTLKQNCYKHCSRDIQTLRHTFNKSHLVNQHPGICQNQASPAQSKLLHIVKGNKFLAVHMKKHAGRDSLDYSCFRQKQAHLWNCFCSRASCTWWAVRKDGEVRCEPQRDLMLGENRQ